MIQDMYGGCTTLVRIQIGSTESFEVKVGLNQSPALSPLLFITVMDVISEKIGRGPSHAILFADDLVLRILARNCCLARMLPGEAENGVGMNRSVREGKKCEAL